jgi:hypothetical protein
VCGYSITDPVCKRCYIKETMIILNDLKIHPIIINFIKNKLKSMLYSETLNDTECILCKNDTVSTCRYCFSVILIRLLRDLNFTEDLIEHFGYSPQYGEDFLEHEDILVKPRPIFNYV